MGKKIALITGASGTIGRAISLELARSGVDVILHYNRDLESVLKTKKEVELLGVKAYLQEGDLSIEEEVTRIFSYIRENFNRLDILINNAGITRDGLLARMDKDDFIKVINTNLISSFYTMREASRIMIRKRAGSIVNISSIVGIRGNPGQGNYSASKAGLIGLTKSLAKELAGRNIRVNAVAPGFIKSNMTASLKEKQRKDILGQIPMAVFGQAEDIALAVRFLALEEAKYITGQVISIDGGLNV